VADVVAPAARSRMMSRIRGKNTSPELLLRKELHREGFRYRLHVKGLPGNPDIVLPKYRAAIFVNGCFWHMHDCHLFKWPSTRREFWRKKLEGNARRDCDNEQKLLNGGWRVLKVWECAMKGRAKLPLADLVAETSSWLRSDAQTGEVRGYE